MTAGLAVAGLAVTAAFLAVVLRGTRPEQAMAIGLAAGAVLVVWLLKMASPVLDSLRNMVARAGLSEEYGTVLLKALGLCLLTQLAADVCRDAGEQALAAKAELGGKILMLLLALPLFEKIAALAVELLGSA